MSEASFKKHALRLLLAYLIAAAVEEVALAVQLGPPHGNWGVLILGGLMLFWIAPPISIYQVLLGDPLPHLMVGALWFLGTLVVVTCHLYRIEIIDLVKRSSGTTRV